MVKLAQDRAREDMTEPLEGPMAGGIPVERQPEPSPGPAAPLRTHLSSYANWTVDGGDGEG